MDVSEGETEEEEEADRRSGGDFLHHDSPGLFLLRLENLQVFAD